MPPTLKPSLNPDLPRDDSLTSQLLTEKSQFKPQLTSLYLVSITCIFQLNRIRYNDYDISHAFRQLAPNEYWTAIN